MGAAAAEYSPTANARSTEAWGWRNVIVAVGRARVLMTLLQKKRTCHTPSVLPAGGTLVGIDLGW